MRFPRVRWFLAAVCLTICVRLMVAALQIPGLGAAGHLIFSFATFILMVLLIVPETAFRMAEWCSRPITNIIYPSDRLDRPPLSYTMAREYSRRMRVEEAITEYEGIIQFYPQEAEAYLELMALAKKAGDEPLYERCEGLYKRRFKSGAD